MPSDASDDPPLKSLAYLARLFAEGKLDEARALSEEIRSRHEPGTVTIGRTGVVHRRGEHTVLRVTEGGSAPLASGALRKEKL
jgi:hypothetical protein